MCVELTIERDEQVDEPRRSSPASFRLQPDVLDEEVDRPQPRERPEPELEHARPVDADERRVRVEPARELREQRGRDSGVAGQPEGAAEREPVLMPIQLPDDLVIAARRIEVRHRRPERARARGGRAPDRDASRAGQCRPGRWGRASKRRAAIAEQIVFAGDDAIGARGGVAARRRETRDGCAATSAASIAAPITNRCGASREVARQRALRLVPVASARARARPSASSRERRQRRQQIGPRPSRGATTRVARDRQRCAPARRAAPGDLGAVHARQPR